MAEETKDEGTNIETGAQKTRRAFVHTAAQVAVTAPAVGLLLSASTKPAAAAISPYQASIAHILDDYNFGNNEEDVDAVGGNPPGHGGGAAGPNGFGTNFNPFNGTANQDDHVP